MNNKKVDLSESDAKYLLEDIQKILAKKTEGLSRRRFLRQGITLGGVTMLTGCNLSDNPDVESVLNKFSSFNDRIQGWLFSGNIMARLC